MGLRLLAIGAVIYSSKFLRKQSALVRTARARRGNDIDPYCWPQYERTIFTRRRGMDSASTLAPFEISTPARTRAQPSFLCNDFGRHSTSSFLVEFGW